MSDNTVTDDITTERDMNKEAAGGCPVAGGQFTHPTENGGNADWWPNS